MMCGANIYNDHYAKNCGLVVRLALNLFHSAHARTNVLELHQYKYIKDNYYFTLLVTYVISTHSNKVSIVFKNIHFTHNIKECGWEVNQSKLINKNI